MFYELLTIIPQNHGYGSLINSSRLDRDAYISPIHPLEHVTDILCFHHLSSCRSIETFLFKEHNLTLIF